MPDQKKICRNQTKNRGKIKGEEQNYLRKHRNLVRRREKTRGCRTGISRRWNFLTWSFRLYRGKIRIIRCRPRRFRRCRRPAVEMEGDQTARIDRTDREDFLGTVAADRGVSDSGLPGKYTGRLKQPSLLLYHPFFECGGGI